MEQDTFDYRYIRDSDEDPKGFWEKSITYGGVAALVGALIIATGFMLAPIDEFDDF
ncbi:hypothetical protein GF362_01505 [Candidatus Dojkabacteria bacterium]|nr:hypothetical protein [Candidatus Dojkabacteria bacterium]